MPDKDDREITVTTRTKNNKTFCKQAPEHDMDWKITAKDLGNVLNEAKIRVIHCQPGCCD